MRDYRLPCITVVKRTPQPPKKEEVVVVPPVEGAGRELVLVIDDYIKMTEHFG